MLNVSDYNYPEGDISEDTLRSIEKNINEVEIKAKESKKKNVPVFVGNFRIDYSKVLNEEQLKAVFETDGPMLIIAGAGSGKTRTIVYKVCYLIEKEVLPESIVLLTFTKKAAAEMLDRILKLTQLKDSKKVSIGTFHSFAAKLLRRYCRIAEIDPTFSIMDEADSAHMVAMAKESLNIKENSSKSLFPNKNNLLGIISAARNKSTSIEFILKTEHPKLIEYLWDIQQITEKYHSLKRRANVFDYDDLLEVLEVKLRENREFRETIHKQYKYFLVDEYQDTNTIQRQILKLLSSQTKNITVVGDDAQSIYGFRGANFENILSFSKDFPEVQVIKVERNYRSSPGILDFTNSVINHAILGYKKHLYTERTKNGKPYALKFYDEESEAGFIVDAILDIKNKGGKLNDVSVLYRSSWQSNFLQKELLAKRIPFITVGGIKFIERKHIKDMLSYLRVSINNFDIPAWTRLLQGIEGIGKKTVNNIIDDIRNDSQIKNVYGGKKYFKDLERLILLIDNIKKENILEKKVDLIFGHYFPILDKTEEDSEIRKNDLHSLQKMIQSYESINEFLNDFSLEPPNQATFEGDVLFESTTDNDFLTLSTIHSAKGLEWNHVFVMHCLDGLLPSYRSFYKILDIEEERRLFYVACTRAKNDLFITMPSFAMSFNEYFSNPSRFIAEADTNTFEFVDN